MTTILRIGLILTLALACGCARRSNIVVVDSQRDQQRAREENDRAFELIQKGKYAQAEEILKRALAADVMYGPARNNMGLVYYHTNRLYLAAWEFENAIRLMPHQPEPRNNLGLALETAGKLNRAAESYQQARDIEPDNPQFIANLARVKVRQGDTDEPTRKLLQELIFKDSRPQWSEWARMNLLRIDATPTTNPTQE